MKALNNISIRLRFSFLLGPLERDSTVVQFFYLLKRRNRWTDGPMDGQTDLCTDLRMYRPSYRDARTHLQTTWIKMNEWGAAAKAFKEANPLLSAVSGIFDKNKVDRQPSDAFFILLFNFLDTSSHLYRVCWSVHWSICQFIHKLVGPSVGYPFCFENEQKWVTKVAKYARGRIVVSPVTCYSFFAFFMFKKQIF